MNTRTRIALAVETTQAINQAVTGDGDCERYNTRSRSLCWNAAHTAAYRT
jgi:hypothetical protein